MKLRLLVVLVVVVALLVGFLTGRWPIGSADLTAIAEIGRSIGALLTPLVAYLALDTWRRQLKGTDEYSLAKKSLFNLKRLERIIREVRQPFVVDKTRAMEEWNEVGDKIRTDFTECKVLWGEEFAQKHQKLYTALQKLRFALGKMEQLRVGGFIPPESERRVREENEPIAEIQGDDETQDHFSGEMREAVNTIEKELIKHLR